MTPDQLLEKFDEMVKKERDVIQKKSHDYSGDADVMKNFITVEHMGIVDSAARGLMVRLTDKYMRIVGFLNKGELKVSDESINDTIMDMRNYLLFLSIAMKLKNDTKFDK